MAFLEKVKEETRPDALLFCTWGDQGATVLQRSPDTDDQWQHVPCWTPGDGTAVVDTIGAGDTFIAGMLYALNCMQDWTLKRKLSFANEIAGRKVYQLGFDGLGSQMHSVLELRQ
jgi:ketohexokinase